MLPADVAKSGIRNMVLAMTALTVFVIAMIASYAGAFAKPTLHHLTVAVAAPEKVVDAVRGRDALAIKRSAMTLPPDNRSVNGRPIPLSSSAPAAR